MKGIDRVTLTYGINAPTLHEISQKSHRMRTNTYDPSYIPIVPKARIDQNCI
jgi:hypothetical protein